VFWQPGCSSCLRTKEFLAKQGIEFESINVHGNPEGMAQLAALGARSVPVVALGERYTLCQSFGDVVKFLDLPTKLVDPLPPAALVPRLGTVLATAARLTRQFDEMQLRSPFRDRDRTPAGLAFHVARVAEMGLDAAAQRPLEFEGFNDQPPPHWTAADIAGRLDAVRARLGAWWPAQTDTALGYTVPTYYGRRTMHDVLERTTWHAAQHTRQLALMLESHGTAPDRPLSAAELDGLPVPDEVWDR
jgi:glutaredoxin